MKGTELCNYADDTIMYACDSEIKNMLNRSEPNSNQIKAWFPENCMNLNEEKCHFIIFGASEEKVDIRIGDMKIEESDDDKLLGIILDKKLSSKNMHKSFAKKLTKRSMLLPVSPFTWSPRS